jgi:iron complex outermembrane receptor protein
LGISGNWTIPLTSGDINLNASYYYNSGLYHEPDNRLHQPAYSQVNASIRWTSREGGYSVLLWGNNLTNTAVENLGAMQGFGSLAVAKVSYAPPRTYGVTVGKKF